MSNVNKMISAEERLEQIKKIAMAIEIELETLKQVDADNKVTASIQTVEMILRDAQEISKLILKKEAA